MANPYSDQPQDSFAPDGTLRMVLDTDAFNEVDDQFAIAYALKSGQRLRVEAIYAAPFDNEKSTGPGDGMRKSYDEIQAVLDRMADVQRPPVFLGSAEFFTGDTPPDSDAVQDLIVRASAADPRTPLYVVAIGAPTNVASALVQRPDIADRIRIVWLGGHARHWHRGDEFNLRQDTRSSRTVLASAAPLLLVPCMGVVSHLTTTLAELETSLDAEQPINQLLLERFRSSREDHFGYARAVWDVAAIAALVDPDWVPSEPAPRQAFGDDLRWLSTTGPSRCRIATHVNRNAIFGDLFGALNAPADITRR